MTFWLLNPSGTVVAQQSTVPTSGPPTGDITLVAPTPAAGTWEIDVELNLTTSGKEFTQTVNGDVGYDQPPPAAALASAH